MGKITVIRVDAGYPDDNDIFNVMHYACSEKDKDVRVCFWDTRGLPKNITKAVALLVRTQEFMRKDGGRRINHTIISFPDSVTDEKLVYAVADRLADHLGHEYPLIYGIHEDTNHLHIHFAMNTISRQTGKKWHASKKEFDSWCKDIADLTNEILADWGIYLQ